MITINKDTTNNIIFTLTEKSQLPAPYFLFSFTNDSSGENKLFNMTDFSGYQRRYNLFNLIENDTENLSGGTVSLQYGWGKYEVYESTTPTLQLSGTTGRVLEEGRFYVNGYPLTSSNNNTVNDIYL